MSDPLVHPSMMPAAAQNLRYWRVAGAVFCGVMLVLHMAAGLHSAGVTDFWRDMYWSTLIAHGERFPLTGPPINQIAELGPWWHYFLALPIALTGRLAAAAVTIQIIAALKYVLAWRIGTRLIDACFGLTFAVSLAVAGWSTAAFMFPSHPAVVETTVLLLGIAAWRLCANLSLVNALWFGLAAAACVHAHPTTLLYVAVAGAAVLWRHRSVHALALLGLAAAVVLLSLLPPWLDPEPINEVWRRTLVDYAAKDFGNGVVTRVPKFIAALFVGGAWVGLLLLTPWKLATVKVAWWLYCLCIALAVGGVASLSMRATPLRRWTFAAALFLLAQIVFVVVARAWTPIWMVPSCLLPLAFIVAAGWYEGFANWRIGWRVAAFAGFTVCALLSIVPFGFFLRDLHGVRAMPLANPFGDIVQSEDNYIVVPGSPLSVRQIDALGGVLCAPVTLHARLATAVERSLATSARNACGDWPDLHFGGTYSGAHLAGVPARVAKAVGIAPDRDVGGLALYSRVRAIAPAEGARPTRLARMQVGIDAVHAAPSPLAFDFVADAADVVVLTNRIPAAAAMNVNAVRANGVPAQVVYDEGNLLIYRCAACLDATEANWQVRLDGVEANLDLIVLEKERVR